MSDLDARRQQIEEMAQLQSEAISDLTDRCQRLSDGIQQIKKQQADMSQVCKPVLAKQFAGLDSWLNDERVTRSQLLDQTKHDVAKKRLEVWQECCQIMHQLGVSVSCLVHNVRRSEQDPHD
ncbi:MAG: hypothetical protein JXM73_17115 [Anaerolineae bacterium]|nr:hypothetical protein [Anaerolineae bacterium]